MHKSHSNKKHNAILYFYRIRIICHWIIYGYAPMIRSFVYRAFVRLRFPYSSLVSFCSFVYRAFVSCIVRFSYRSCEAFGALCNFYDPGSVHLFSTHVLFKSVLFKYSNYYHICDVKYLLDKHVVK